MNTISTRESVFESAATLLRARTGLVFPPARHTDIEAAIRKLMITAKIDNVSEYLARIEEDPLLLDALIAELTVGETYFFRDPAHFVFVREEFLAAMRELRHPDHCLRIWSAGCASGEEAYSLAILFEEEGLSERVRILGTDISRKALARARNAVYSPWSLRGNGTRPIGQYLHRKDGAFVLSERFRRRVAFAYLNLAEDNYPTLATDTCGMDLILCRNVLIYLDARTIRDVARRFYESLADGGVLLTGPSDPLLADFAPYEIQATSTGIVYRKSSKHSSVSNRASAFSSPEHALKTPALPHNPWIEPTPVPIAPPLLERPRDFLAEAHAAFAQGDHARAAELTSQLKNDVVAAALHVRALAKLGDVAAAAEAAAEACAIHLASVEIGYLSAVLLMNLGRHREAHRALRRILYLDPSLEVAYFTLGAALHRLGDLKGAKRAYRNARDLAARRPSEEVAPLSDGEKAGRLAGAAQIQLALLEPLTEAAT